MDRGADHAVRIGRDRRRPSSGRGCAPNGTKASVETCSFRLGTSGRRRVRGGGVAGIGESRACGLSDPRRQWCRAQPRPRLHDDHGDTGVATRPEPRRRRWSRVRQWSNPAGPLGMHGRDCPFRWAYGSSECRPRGAPRRHHRPCRTERGRKEHTLRRGLGALAPFGWQGLHRWGGCHWGSSTGPRRKGAGPDISASRALHRSRGPGPSGPCLSSEAREGPGLGRSVHDGQSAEGFGGRKGDRRPFGGAPRHQIDCEHARTGFAVGLVTTRRARPSTGGVTNDPALGRAFLGFGLVGD